MIDLSNDYVRCFEQAKELLKTHQQCRCYLCGLWTVWVDKKTGEQERTCKCGKESK